MIFRAQADGVRFNRRDADRRAQSSSYAAAPPEPSGVIVGRNFGYAGLLAAMGMAAENMLGRSTAGWQAQLGLGAAILLVVALIGDHTKSWLSAHLRGELARIYAAAFKGAHQAAPRPDSGPTVFDRIALAFADLIDSTKLAMLGRDSLARWAHDMRSAVESRRSQSAMVAAALDEDAHAIADSALASRKAQAEISAGLGDVRDHAARAAQATSSMALEAAALGRSVRGVTAQSNRASDIIGRLTEDVSDAQRRMAALSDTVSDLSSLAAESFAADGAVGDGSMIAGMARGVSSLTAEAALLRAAVDGIGQRIQAQTEWSDELLRAIRQQASSVGRLIAHVESAHSEIIVLRDRTASMDISDLALGAGPAVRKAVERLPVHADAMAQILRGLPDLTTG